MALPAIAAIWRVYQGTKATYDVMKQLGSDATAILKKIAGNWLEVNDAAFKTARTMALGREQAQAYNKQLLSATKDLAAQFGVTAKELADFQKSYAESIGRNVTLSKQQLAHMSVMSKIAGEDAGKLIDEYDKVGVGIARATAYTGRLQDRAKALGVSPAKATKLMADNIKLAASYSFRNGVADIEKMSLKAASMRMDMQSIMNATEKFADIEGAISTSANIQMLGGSFAREFSNPMGAMYEAMADPAAFQDRILRTIEGKGKYDSKTGAVTFDPVTMRMMREMAKQLGMSAEQLNTSAMASVQNQKVDEELKARGTYDKWKDKGLLEAIRNLSRTNVNENGEHFVTVLEDGEEKQVKISELTEEQIRIATDNQLTQEGLWSDVQDIKTILERVHGRARETVSTKEQLEGVNEWWETFKGNLFNGLFTGLSNGLNGYAAPMISTQYFSEGGNVKPLHAAFGTIVPGRSYIGDRVPAMLNSGEMVLNQGQQKGLFDLIKNVALTGVMAYGGNKFGRHFGIGGVGTNMALTNLLSGGNMGIGGMLGAGAGSLISGSMFRGIMPMAGMGRTITIMNPTVMMNGKTIMNGSIGDGALVDELEGIADAASDATRATRSFSTRLYGVAHRNTLLGGLSRTYLKARTKRRAFGRRLSRGFNNIGIVKGTKSYGNFIGHKSYYDSGMHQYRINGNIVKRAEAGNWFTKGILRGKGILHNFGKDIGNLKGSEQIAENAGKAVSKVGSTGKILGSLGKAGKIVGKKIPYIGTALAVGGAVSGMMGASSQYDAQIDKINSSNMSELDKARAKDRATKQKNAGIGGSIGSAAGSLGGMAAGAATGAAIGSVIPVVGTAIGGILGGAIGAFGGEKLGGLFGKGIGSLFGGNEEKKVKEKEEKILGIDEGSIKNREDLVKYVKSIDSKIGIKHSIGLTPLSLPRINPITDIITSAVRSLPIVGNFMKVLPSVRENGQSGIQPIGKTDINLNVSGTIKLDGGGKVADLDISKLLDTPEFKRQLADIITRRINENSNSGKRNMESERNNMASQYNKSGNKL
jgi:hypothetical protein